MFRIQNDMARLAEDVAPSELAFSVLRDLRLAHWCVDLGNLATLGCVYLSGFFWTDESLMSTFSSPVFGSFKSHILISEVLD